MPTPPHRRIVTILDKSMCLNCRFNDTVVVAVDGQPPRRIMQCKRLDCDNWGTVIARLEPENPDEPK